MPVKLTQKEFIERSKTIHNDKYDYSKTIYTGANDKIIIICPDHGEYIDRAYEHSKGKECQKCKGYKRLTNIEFINYCNKIHKNKYDYTDTHYKGMMYLIKIKCPNHIVFEQLARDHYKGSDCPDCANIIRSIYGRLSVEEFFKRAYEVHKDAYDYSEICYLNAITNIKIKCKIHNEIFEQTPQTHLKGSGCQKCAKRNVSKIETSWLDSLNIPQEFRRQILYIDNKQFYPDAIDKEKKIIWEFYGDYWHGNPNIYKSEDINKVSKKSFGKLYQNTLNKEKILNEAGYEIISIWESDYKNI